MDKIQNKYVLYESKERSSKQKQIKFEIIDLDIYRGKVKITYTYGRSDTLSGLHKVVIGVKYWE